MRERRESESESVACPRVLLIVESLVMGGIILHVESQNAQLPDYSDCCTAAVIPFKPKRALPPTCSPV